MITNHLRSLLGIPIGAVWIYHGIYSKIGGGIPRHRRIVARILGEELAGPATMAIGAMETMLGLWAMSGRKRRACATVQTLALISMNSLEMARAKDLLISAPGMVALNLGFGTAIWTWAGEEDPEVRKCNR